MEFRFSDDNKINLRAQNTLLLTLFIILALSSCTVFRGGDKTSRGIRQSEQNWDDTIIKGWPSNYREVEITSSIDKKVQRAYFRKSTSQKAMPLIISLHTWSGNYEQEDRLLPEIEKYDWNYLHPDFRGPNRSCENCCSKLVLADIDDAIEYALANCKVNPDQIHIIGASGGGYATLCAFMKSKHKVNSFHSWVPISDLLAWYSFATEKKLGYARDVLACSCSSDGNLNKKVAMEKSPYHWVVPVRKLASTKLYIYAGVNDGVKGSVPITQTLDFYNKILKELEVTQKEYYVSEDETAWLLENRKPLPGYGKIGDRDICLMKTYKNITVTIFDGGHEMLECGFDLVSGNIKLQ
jgi:pimeloyl-ACP methyl ester carboxylesterase